MTVLSELIVDEYSGDASYKEIVDICRATITLFNCLKGKDAALEQIVSFFRIFITPCLIHQFM